MYLLSWDHIQPKGCQSHRILHLWTQTSFQFYFHPWVFVCLLSLLKVIIFLVLWEQLLYLLKIHSLDCIQFVINIFHLVNSFRCQTQRSSSLSFQNLQKVFRLINTLEFLAIQNCFIFTISRFLFVYWGLLIYIFMQVVKLIKDRYYC